MHMAGRYMVSVFTGRRTWLDPILVDVLELNLALDERYPKSAKW
jgi:hypothetical protein